MADSTANGGGAARRTLCAVGPALLVVAMAGSTWAQSAETAKPGAVDRLRQRSAADRWRELNEQPRSKLLESPSQNVVEGAGPHAAPTKRLPNSESPDSSVTSRAVEVAPEVEAGPLPDEAPLNPPAPKADRRKFKSAVRDTSQKLPVHEVVQIAPIPDQDLIRSPKDLKRLSSIQPFLDYEPDSTLKDQCANLCPRPTVGCKECQNRAAHELGPDDIPCPDCPEEVRLGSDAYVGRSFPGLVYNWVASDLYHYPLYFQDVHLERYGHTRPFYVQPFVSFGRATFQGVMLPYQSVLYPPCQKQYALGHYRPGACAPYQYNQMPLSAKAALVEAAAVTGGVYLYAPP